MNQIIIRTNSSEYAGGSKIYGAIYLRILEPVVADTIAISFLGEEFCSWSKLSLNRADGLSRSRSVSQDSTDTGFHESHEPNTAELSFREVAFSGKITHTKCDMILKQYSEGVIPLGCYAYPFQFTLKQGLPNSFEKAVSFDEVKRTTYNAEVSYKVTAMLRSSSSRNESDVQCTNKLVLRSENLLARRSAKITKRTQEIIKACCCFTKGEISLVVTLDKGLFTLGETMHVKFQIENSSDVVLSTAKIRLWKTINLKAKRRDDEGKLYENAEAFRDEDLYSISLDMGTSKSKSFDVPVILKHSKDDIVTTSFGSIVKCRYHLEVELDVPFDNDVSVIIPIEVYPNSLHDWEAWEPPQWIRDVQVVDAEGLCSVPRHILQCTEYHNIPLPLAGL